HRFTCFWPWHREAGRRERRRVIGVGTVSGTKDGRARGGRVARAIWSGTLSYGLVSIPVRLFPATAPRNVRFHQFDRDTGRRIRYRRVAGEAPAPDPFLRQPSQGGDEVPGAS